MFPANWIYSGKPGTNAGDINQFKIIVFLVKNLLVRLNLDCDLKAKN